MHDRLTERGIRDDSDISLVMPMGVTIPPSPAASEALLVACADRQISWHPERLVSGLDPDRNVVMLSDGSEMPFVLFLGVPVHRVPAVVEDSELTVDGWFPVNPLTLPSVREGAGDQRERGGQVAALGRLTLRSLRPPDAGGPFPRSLSVRSPRADVGRSGSSISREQRARGSGGSDVLELVIRGGTVVDGTGAPPRHADVGIRHGRIVAVGNVDEPAAAHIEADGLMVTPGFVDLHTHYDAQLSWDPSASPSPLHGVTTIIGGNCGFSLAPAGPDHADYLARMMARVEGMPLSVLELLDWSWGSFGEWVGRLDSHIGVNAGFLVGHSTLRRAVMGDDAVGMLATDAQMADMVALAKRSFAEGALGLSTSQAHTHNDGDGRPVPSRAAGRAELEALCSALAEHAGTTLELIIPGCLNGFTEDEVDLMATLSLLANRPANWNVLGVSSLNPAACEHQLEASTKAADRGAKVVALTLPHTMKIRLSFEHGAVIDGLPGWREIFALGVPERMERLTDPDVRKRLDEGAHSKEAGILAALANWRSLVIDETFSEANDGLAGRTVGAIAAERGQEPFDALVDVVLADRLRTGLRPPIPESEADWDLRARVWQDPRTVVGGSDAGAHLDMMCGAIYSTSMLGDGVRKRGLLSWEAAVHELTDVPARLYGLRDRGRVAEGWCADLVVLDPDRVGYGPEHTRDDLPGGASRLYAEAEGIEHVLVNGVEIARGGKLTGATPGAVLRSGVDTDTVTVPGG